MATNRFGRLVKVVVGVFWDLIISGLLSTTIKFLSGVVRKNDDNIIKYVKANMFT